MKKELIDLLKLIRKCEKRKDAYLDKLPIGLNVAFIENDMHDAQTEVQCELMKAVFGDLYDEVAWFLWDLNMTSEGPHIVEADGKMWTFKTDEDYYKYLEEV